MTALSLSLPSRTALRLRLRLRQPRERVALAGLLLATGVLYLWNLSASGYANSFYSAAVQAGSESWQAFFFGSSDAGNAITVDKPPAALWPMALSVRLFGLSSWAILVPEALMGVAAVGVLYAAVRRAFGAGAGLVAAGAFALTPVAALMFRFNNPDALLCLLMVAAVYAVLRALEHGSTRWLVLAGVCFGVGFLTKTLQAWLILPPLAAAYLACAPAALGVWRRVRQLLLAGLAMVAAGGWWVAIVELWPAGSRPYIGGSQENSFLELTFGYNGFGRLTGDEPGSVGGGGGPGPGGGGGAWGETGLGRLFDAESGGQISWLLPGAAVLLVAALWLTRRAPRTDARRAAFLAWGGSAFLTFAVFSFMSGIYHAYYTVALAPYLAALVGMGAALLWERRAEPVARGALAVAVAATAWWAYVLLGRSPDWHPWLRWVVLCGGAGAALGLLVTHRRLARGAAAVGLAAALAGPLAYTLHTVGTGHTGSIVSAGPATGGMFGQGVARALPVGGDGGDGGQGQAGLSMAPRMPNGGGPGQQGMAPGGPAPEDMIGGPGGGPGGGLLDGPDVSEEMRRALEADADAYDWVAAAVGSQTAAGYQLATEEPVMAVGGFNGTDPSPTLAEFQEYVAAGRIHYFVTGGMGGMGGMAPAGLAGNETVTVPGGGGADEGTASEIAEWVADTFREVTVDGVTLYDLTRPV